MHLKYLCMRVCMTACSSRCICVCCHLSLSHDDFNHCILLCVQLPHSGQRGPVPGPRVLQPVQPGPGAGGLCLPPHGAPARLQGQAHHPYPCTVEGDLGGSMVVVRRLRALQNKIFSDLCPPLPSGLLFFVSTVFYV